jgi:MoaD family protein
VAEVTVKYFMELGQVAGKKTETLSVEPGTLRSLFEKLAALYGEALLGGICDLATMQPRERTKVLVNGRDIIWLQGFDTPLKDGDKVTLFPAAR